MWDSALNLQIGTDAVNIPNDNQAGGEQPRSPGMQYDGDGKWNRDQRSD
ncbi:hypothetical protein SBA4_1800002 [Candidatus Sulfopaludibacter sp. SbA4]|nr:hypothetical protein SBA4_1800002 [Candidatus Sulfopaludibacter sp. SbA4]